MVDMPPRQPLYSEVYQQVTKSEQEQYAENEMRRRKQEEAERRAAIDAENARKAAESSRRK